MDNLYDGQEYFKLIIGEEEIYIDEPIGWNQVKIKLTEDPDFFGFNYEYIDPKTKLVFTEGFGGSPLIKEIYEQFGNDGKIKFQTGLIKNEVEEIVLELDLNLNYFSEKDEGISTSVESTSFESKFRTRYSTKISLNAVQDLDGNLIDPITPFDIDLHSKTIVKLSRSRTDPSTPVLGGEMFQSESENFLFFQVDTIGTSVNNVRTMTSAPGGFVNDPLVNELYIFQSFEGGSTIFDFNGSITGALFVKMFGRIGRFTVTPKLWVKRGGSLIVDHSFAPIYEINTNDSAIEGVDLIYNNNLEVELLPGDKVFFNLFINSEEWGSAFLAGFESHVSNVDIKQQTEAESSIAKAYNLFDALNFAVYAATGQKDRVLSTFLSSGCGSNYCITNGFQIRRFMVFDRPVQVSIEEIIKSINAIWCVGIGFTKKEGQDFIYAERFEIFKRNNLIHEFGEISDLEENHDTSITFNEVQIGYEKFEEGESGDNTLDEFNTVREYLLPITTYKDKKVIKSPFIASGFSIEKQRREQFEETPTESATYDDNIFIIDYSVNNEGGFESTKDQKFETVANVLSPSTSYNLSISPARMFFNWSEYFNASLQKKPGDSFIICSFAKMNDKMVTRYKEGVLCTLEKGPTQDIYEGGDIRLIDYNLGSTQYVNKEIRFSSRMTYKDIFKIVAALRGYNSILDSGFVSFVDRKEIKRYGYIKQIEYNPVSEKADLILRERNNIDFFN